MVIVTKETMLSFQIIAAKPPGLPEKILCGVIIVLFGLAGIGLLRAAFLELRRVRRKRGQLLTLPGRVISIDKERRYRADSKGDRRFRTNYWMHYFPVIVFTTPEGQSIGFRSELGESHQIRTSFSGIEIAPPPPSWKDGQQVDVYYDPSGEMKPCLATAWSLWFTGFGMLAAGIMFTGCSVMMWFLFGSKVLF